MLHHSSKNRTVKLILTIFVGFGMLTWPQMGNQQLVSAKSGNKTFLPFVSDGNAWYVSSTGSSGGNGSQTAPWDLSTAFNHPDQIQPGDTLWLEGGRYGTGGSTLFKSKLEGAEGAPITIRAVSGERVTIDGAIQVLGDWSIFWGLEVMNSDSNRSSTQSGSTPSDISRQGGFQVYGANTKFINNIVHDTRSGFGIWEKAINAEAYGNLVYNNGWKGPDRMHGHGVYSQNDVGTKRILDNIIFSNFDFGVHVYTEGSHITGYHFEGNVEINDEFLIGGLQPADRITLIGNHIYGERTSLGFSVENGSLVLQGNIFGAVDDSGLVLKRWKSVAASGNTLWSQTSQVINVLTAGGNCSYSWNQNSYIGGNGSPFELNETEMGWDQWRSAMGVDQESSYKVGQMSGVNVIVRPNAYQPKRGNIIVYNWDQNAAVSVDISNLGLAVGDTYNLHNAQNYYDEVITGTYTGGTISIPMQGWTLAKPIGWGEPLDSLTFPRFGVFIIEVP